MTNKQIRSFCATLTLAFMLAFPVLMSPLHQSSAHSAPKAELPMISEKDWLAYSEKFLAKNGRIMDDANGNISHSEGQGYGLLLAVMANRPADFELIWSFTRTEMLIRNDCLSVWKWDPASRPHITDTNNASDGDVLIAYALALAAKKWNNSYYRKTATTITNSLLKKLIIAHNNEMILLPAIRGFSVKDRDDGPVINLSYWVFEAFPVLDELVPSPSWKALEKSGLQLLQQSRFGADQLPSDWISLKDEPQPATGFEPEFSYNNLRIVLYLARAGLGKQDITRQLAKAMTGQDGAVNLVNITTNEPVASLNEAGYRIIPQLTACISNGTKLSEGVASFKPNQYYPSTLHLLALSYIANNHPECL
ncbi:hypothetical protein KQ944_09395 [Bacillus subtilis]|uniref:glycosyl hydrolase family 8 n=1 Tax=Pseudochrobactrum asaccharolyticum TaxID=354351 RepID=UPI001EFFFD4C|nr:glycosyl hydrolase family 8 [Pseudochrobactrum asaccharolyticum]MCF7671838.1 hypothetical protein [Bacillus subtilis]